MIVKGKCDYRRMLLRDEENDDGVGGISVV